MFLRELDAPITSIRGAGDTTARLFAKAGIHTVSDLLRHYPRDWEDRSRMVPLKDFSRFPSVCTVITVLAHDWIGFGRMRTLKVHVEDDTGRAVLVCFNRPFLERQLIVGSRYRLWGRFYYKYGEIQSTAFEIEPVHSGSANSNAAEPGSGFGAGPGKIMPVYPLSAGLNQGLLRKLVKRALDEYAPALEEELPRAIIERNGLLSKPQAIRAIHLPSSMGELDLARKTLIYGELFYLEVIIGRRALERRKITAQQEKKAPFTGKKTVLNGQPIGAVFSEDISIQNNKIIRTALNWIDRHPIGIVKTVIGDIEVSRRGIRDSFNHVSFPDKLYTLPIIKKALEHGIYLSHSPDKHGKKIENYYFAAPVEIDGNRKIIFIRVRQKQGGQKRFYVHDVYSEDEIKKPGATKTTSAAQVPPQGKAPDLYKSIIYKALAVNDASFTPLQQRLIERLPFTLTTGQTGAIAEINRDMDSPWPMARLLQGDVGSGKTLVSFLAALKAVEAGGQAAIMAPTELLARQHAENAARLLEPIGIRLSFLTGNIKAAGRKELLKRLAAGEIDIALGTHALFSQDVVYRDLRLAVVDEQHRFGVTQRSLIMAKGDHPGLLMMSATPIPRTLALTVFGDLDVSIIRDLPPGRKPIKTHLAMEANEDKVYDFVRKELAAGRQAYFVYPLIEASEGGRTADLKDAESMAERLAREVFPQYKTALVHSRLDEEEKRQTMDAFRRGEISILTATSVVEVGVDVPNATCMVIEHAERFGLSALHQLRGRVGRGDQQSYCFLVYSDPEGPLATGENLEDWQARLKVMLESNDGFVIAEEDLKIRGPGQIAGIEQSGYLSLGMANPIRDAAELERARTDAFAILEADPGLLLPEHRCVAEVLERAPPFGGVGL